MLVVQVQTRNNKLTGWLPTKGLCQEIQDVLRTKWKKTRMNMVLKNVEVNED